MQKLPLLILLKQEKAFEIIQFDIFFQLIYIFSDVNVPNSLTLFRIICIPIFNNCTSLQIGL